MATEISYRHEYLTGFAMAPDRTRMRVTVMAFNHGPVEEHVRVLGITLHGHVLHDGGDEKVPVASQAWLTQFDLFDKYEFFPPVRSVAESGFSRLRPTSSSARDTLGTRVWETPRRARTVRRGLRSRITGRTTSSSSRFTAHLKSPYRLGLLRTPNTTHRQTGTRSRGQPLPLIGMRARTAANPAVALVGWV